MGKEEVELIPSGLITCFINDKEVRILKISPKQFIVRIADEIENIESVKIAFYEFNKYRYEEINIENFDVVNIEYNEFFLMYKIDVKDSIYEENVRRIFRDYNNYIMLKNFGFGSEFSENMVGYPANQDECFYEYYDEQKMDWMNAIDMKKFLVDELEIAIKIDNHSLYRKYLDNDISSFKDYYFEKNYVKDSCSLKKKINRLYIGNEFCHNLFPEENQLIEMLQKAINDKVEITLCFTYLRENYIEKNKNIIEKVYELCVKNSKTIEIVINDWGMLDLIKDKKDYLKPILGVLINKRKKDPRYIYKKGYFESKKTLGKNSLNSELFAKFLKEYGIYRYEYENCGYKIDIAKGKHSLQVPFYLTNLSQYCPLNAVCKNGNRARQELVEHCTKYCMDYVFLYPKHLKMVGRYNSLFAFDDVVLKNEKLLKDYINEGIDRIVFNFI